MQDFAAYEQLRDLLAAPSAETRYGAFRALWAGNSKDALVKGELLGRQFNYHVLNVGGPPMIHVTHNRLAEIVVFGADQRLVTPLALNAGNEIMVTSSGGNEITVSKFSVRDGDQKRMVSTRADEVIRTIVELGGTYPDVVQALQEAKSGGALLCRFEVDALPEVGRAYDRVAPTESSESGPAESNARREQPKPLSARAPSELFSSGGIRDSSKEEGSEAKTEGKLAEHDDSDASSGTEKGFFARTLGR
jgi:hypothetical protein